MKIDIPITIEELPEKAGRPSFRASAMFPPVCGHIYTATGDTEEDATSRLTKKISDECGSRYKSVKSVQLVHLS